MIDMLTETGLSLAKLVVFVLCFALVMKAILRWTKVHYHEPMGGVVGEDWFVELDCVTKCDINLDWENGAPPMLSLEVLVVDGPKKGKTSGPIGVSMGRQVPLLKARLVELCEAE